jgi:YbgC/YbaW family acyl-CoA thioester hydrolase
LNEEQPGYVAIRTKAQWGDCDPAGITYFPNYFRWLDQVVHLLAREMGVPREDVLPPRMLGFPMVSLQVEFLAPARLEDEIEVRAWVTHIGRTSLGVRFEFARLGSPEVLLVRGSDRRVHVQRFPGGRVEPRELTPEMRAVLEKYRDPGPDGGLPGAAEPASS